MRVILDEETRTATLVGSRAAIQRFEGRLRDAAGAIPVRTTKRTYTPEHVRPSELAQRLPRLARPMLEPDDGSVFVAPSFEAIDELDTLVIRAEPEQFAVLDELLDQLDTKDATGQQLRVIPVRGDSPDALIARAEDLVAQRVGMLDDKDPAAAPMSIEFDELSGNLIESLPEEIEDLVRLRELDLERAELHDSPRVCHEPDRTIDGSRMCACYV